MLHAVRRIVLVGLAAAMVAAALGWAIGRSRFGSSDEEAIARLESDLRRQFADTAATLARIAADLANAAQPSATTANDPDQTAPRRLFDAIADALAGQEPDRTGITVYDAADAPLAWGGR